MHGTDLFGDIPPQSCEGVIIALFVEVNRESGSKWVTDYTEGEFHLMIVSFGKIEEKDRTPVIGTGSHLYSGKSHTLWRNYPDPSRRVAFRRNSKQLEQSGRKKSAVNRLFFNSIQGVDMCKSGELVPTG